MRVIPSIREIAQLCFEFAGAGPQQPLPPPPVEAVMDSDVEPEVKADATSNDNHPDGPAPELEGQCRQLLLDLGMVSATDLVRVHWNARLRSTAGYARYPSWRIELNPRLLAFDGQVDRTLRHELAHLVAYHRAGHRRIEPHGLEWRKACADLGIPGEPAHHRLPLPRSRQSRRHSYQCPACRVVVHRVRPFKAATACLACCRIHSNGRFDERFRFTKLASQAMQ